MFPVHTPSLRDEATFLPFLHEILQESIQRIEAETLPIHLPKLRGEMRILPGMPFHLMPELFIQLSGKTIFSLPEENLTVRGGEFCLIPRGMPHREEVGPVGKHPFFNIVILHGDNELFFHIAHEVRRGCPSGWIRSHLTGEGCETLLHLLNGVTALARLNNESERKSGVRGFFLAYLSLFLATLKTARPEREPYPVTRARQIVLAFLYDPQLSVGSIARELQMHPDYLSQLFRTYTGQSLQAYISRHRCLRAAELLRATSLNIAQVSEAAGFRDASYFTRFFRTRMGATPLAYRKAAQQRVIS